MKKRLTNIFAVVVCLAAFSVAAFAYPRYRLEITIPFDFQLKRQNLPAGKYSFERINPNDSTLLVLHSIDRKINIIFRVEELSVGKPTEKSKLVFKRSDRGYLLTEIREANNSFIFRILLDDYER